MRWFAKIFFPSLIEKVSYSLRMGKFYTTESAANLPWGDSRKGKTTDS